MEREQTGKQLKHDLESWMTCTRRCQFTVSFCSYVYESQKCQFALDISELNLMYYFKNKCEGFIRFPNARKHLKPHGCRPSGFVVFKCLETWRNLKHEFLKWLFQRNNTKLCSVLFFPFFFKMPCMCDLLYSVSIHCVCELLFLIIQ